MEVLLFSGAGTLGILRNIVPALRCIPLLFKGKSKGMPLRSGLRRNIGFYNHIIKNKIIILFVRNFYIFEKTITGKPKTDRVGIH